MKRSIVIGKITIIQNVAGVPYLLEKPVSPAEYFGDFSVSFGLGVGESDNFRYRDGHGGQNNLDICSLGITDRELKYISLQQKNFAFPVCDFHATFLAFLFQSIKHFLMVYKVPMHIRMR
jgi:hypothetical protein